MRGAILARSSGEKKRIVEGLDIILDESKKAARDAVKRSGVETLGENIRKTVQDALAARDNVVMVRLNKDSLSRLDELVESGMLDSRSESAAYLIEEGIKVRAELFEMISTKVKAIQKARQELRTLLTQDFSGDSQ